MTAAPVNILAIGHEASRTGAPILLWDYLRWLVRNNHARVRCLLGNSGPLLDEFETLCDTRVNIENADSSFVGRVARRMQLGDALNQSRLAKWVNRAPLPDLIYANTVASIPLLQRVQNTFPTPRPTVIHVHELESVLREYDRVADIAPTLAQAAVIVAASTAVKNALVTELSITENLIEVIPEWLCGDFATPTQSSSERTAIRQTIRSQLGIDQEAKICLAAGTHCWRKGPEFIPMIAAATQHRCPDMHFVWIGRETSDRTVDQMKLDAERLGVNGRVHFLGEVANAKHYFDAADFFALTSREDPCPLVMLEAAAHKLPIVCFEKSGGAPDFVRDDAGQTVPYLDIPAFADALADLYHHSSKADAYGAAGYHRVDQDHRPERNCQALLETMQSVLSNPERQS